MIKVLENLSYEERLKELCLFIPREVKVQKGPQHSIPVLKGWLQSRWRLTSQAAAWLSCSF